MTPASAAPAAPSRNAGPLINRNFALLWSGQFVSLLGDLAFATTLIVWVGVVLGRGQAWAPLAVSGVVLAGTAPAVLAGPLAGVFVDRWDKRRTLLVVSALQALAVLALAMVAADLPLPFVAGGRLSLEGRLALVYAVVALVNLGAQFYGPATLALIGDLVAEPLRPRAMGLAQVSASVAGLVAPPVAAPVALLFGAQWAILFDALSFVVAFVALLAVRAPRAARSVGAGQAGHFRREFGQGLRFLLGTRVLRVLLISSMVAWLGGGALSALDIFFTTINLHTPASLYGLLGAAQGVGVLVGAVLASAFALRLGLRRVFAWSVVSLGAIVIVFARMTSFGPAAAVLFVSGIPFAALDVAAVPLMLEVTPRELVGRVTSLMSPAGSAAAVAGAALAGYLDSVVLRGFGITLAGVRFGPVDSIYLGAGLLVLAGGLYAVARLRGDDAPVEAVRYDEVPRQEPSEEPSRAAS